MRGQFFTLAGLASLRLAMATTDRAAEVQSAFRWAWDCYAKHAMPFDELHPVSLTAGKSRNGWGSTVFDSLSTAIIMEEYDVIAQMIPHINGIDFNKTDTSCSLFETTIRYLGGTLSAYDLLTGPYKLPDSMSWAPDMLLEKARALADTLKFSFNTLTGIPFGELNITTKAPTDLVAGHNGIAAFGSLVLEWTRLSDLTGDPQYAAFVQRAQEYLLHPQQARHGMGEPYPGLLGTMVDINTGLFLDAHGGWGGGSDSFYEYLLKMYIYDPDRFGEYRDRWILAANSTMLWLATHPVNFDDLTFLFSYLNGNPMIPKQQHLACFAGGNFIQGGVVLNQPQFVQLGLDLTRSCARTYHSTTTGLGPEVVSWKGEQENQFSDFSKKYGFDIEDSWYQLRPEYVESLYYAYRATGDKKYQDWAWDMYLALNKYTRVQCGFSSISDVMHPTTMAYGNFQESYFLAETLKYLYLVLNDKTGPFGMKEGGEERWVFNTEGHPLKVAGRPLATKGGW